MVRNIGTVGAIAKWLYDFPAACCSMSQQNPGALDASENPGSSRFIPMWPMQAHAGVLTQIR